MLLSIAVTLPLLSPRVARAATELRDAHVFLRGENVIVSQPHDIAGTPQSCRILNERLKELLRALYSASSLNLGVLSVGWYRIELLDVDGEPRDVIVAWTERQGDWAVRGVEQVRWPNSDNLRIEAAYDYLGRALEAAIPAQLSPAFLILPQGEIEKWNWRAVPAGTARKGTPSVVVFQFDAAPRRLNRRRHQTTAVGCKRNSPPSPKSGDFGYDSNSSHDA